MLSYCHTLMQSDKVPTNFIQINFCRKANFVFVTHILYTTNNSTRAWSLFFIENYLLSIIQQTNHFESSSKRQTLSILETPYQSNKSIPKNIQSERKTYTNLTIQGNTFYDVFNFMYPRAHIFSLFYFLSPFPPFNSL